MPKTEAPVRPHRTQAEMEAMHSPAMRFDPNSWYRAATVDRALVNQEARTVPVSFSSEAMVQRWYGWECLLHGPENVDLERLQRLGACLLNHDPDRIVGPLSNITLGPDRRGHCLIGFDKDDEGERAMQKVISGSLRGVSVRYLIHKVRRVDEDEEYEMPTGQKVRGPGWVALRWEPIENSLTPIPADANVGVGRDFTRSLDGIEFEPREDAQRKEPQMADAMRAYLEEQGLDPKATPEQARDFVKGLREKAEADAKAAEAARAAAAKEETAKAVEAAIAASRKLVADALDVAVAAKQEALGMRLVSEGKSLDEIRQTLTAEAEKARGKPAGPDVEKNASSKLDSVSGEDLARAVTQCEILL